MTTHRDIDVFDQDRYLDAVPHEDFALLRANAPVYRNSDPQLSEGHWAVTRHADISYVARHPELFSSHEKGSQPLEFDEVAITMQRMMMVNQDPPAHSRIRSLVNRGFTPRVIGRMRDGVARECERIVEAFLDSGEKEFVGPVAAELPLVVIAEVMGLPREDRHRIFEWSKGIAGESDHGAGGAEGARAAAVDMMAYAGAVGAAKRGCPADDTVSRLVSSDDSGAALTEGEFQAFFVLLTVAGNETTRYAIAGGVEAFAEHPDQWERLRADPELARSAAEEIVRWVTPTKVFRRTAMADVELGGRTVRVGEKMVMHLTSANRDEAVFDAPFTFDIGRDPNPHLGFGGGGPHFCLGRHLALLEIELMFRTLAERVARFEISGPIQRLRSYQFNGITDLPVRLIPC
ncbi:MULTISPECIES: cytochrome P450 [unclassified Nonomuraea]|uniref:cytochrome P450 n=1 Tax=unclassified Nonomuraea TaxID=2593643 RepID=UPI00340236D6